MQCLVTQAVLSEVQNLRFPVVLGDRPHDVGKRVAFLKSESTFRYGGAFAYAEMHVSLARAKQTYGSTKIRERPSLMKFGFRYRFW